VKKGPILPDFNEVILIQQIEEKMKKPW